MEAQINIEFIEVLKQKINKELLKDNPKFIISAENTLNKLCEMLVKYFRQKGIKIKISSQILNYEK